ncbi:hypothetical protein [uncultured Methanobrevibacter sp.]|uniref:hypothetical protein n=1 Tax=uncultured Methanobrevibacter sp. TaxID=253161 RepID=UPI0025E532ED|nr:hypothetical protein [uncultured Methanobrevibacter sp.]
MKTKNKLIIVFIFIFIVTVLCSVFAYLSIVNHSQSNSSSLRYSTDEFISQGQIVPVITVHMKPSVETGLPYKEYTRSWVNYCPFCHQIGTLTDTPKDTHRNQTVPEGEITCDMSRGGCDADFDGVTGKDKLWRNVYLIRADSNQIFNTSNGNYIFLNSYDMDGKSLVRDDQLRELDSNNTDIVGTSFYGE